MRIFLLALLSLGAILLNFEKILASSVLFLFLILCILKRNEIKAKETVLYVLVFLAFFIQTNISIKNHQSKLNNSNDKQVVLTLTSPISINGDYLKTTGKLDEESVQVIYTVNNKEEKEFFEKKFYGGQLKAKIEITDISEKKNFYSFDYKDYQNKRGMYKQVTIKEILATSTEVEGLLNEINLLRAKAIKNINNNLLFDESGFFQALIYGDKTNLENDDKEIYSELGISHLLAISGLHVATLLSTVYYILNKFGIEKNTSEKIILIILPVYTILAGFSPSVIRAASMILIYIIFKRLKLSSLVALLSVFMIMIFINPYYIFDIGFQFSFFITFSLLMSGDYIKESSEKLEQAFKVSLISALASLPITVYYFNNLSFISIISNLVFVPFFTIIIFPLVLISYLAFLLWPGLFNFIFRPILNGVFYINDTLLEIFAWLPNKIIVAHTNHYYIYLLVILAILAIILLNIKAYKKFTLSLIGISLILALINYTVNTNQYVHELKLQGKSVYYIRNEDKTMLVNTSNNYPDFYKDFRKKTREYDIMNEYQSLLDYEGESSFDYLLLTKTSSLEIGQAVNLIGKDKVRSILLLENTQDHKNIKEVIEIAEMKKIKVGIIKNNTSYNVSGIKIDNNEDKVVLNFKDTEYIINKEKPKK